METGNRRVSLIVQAAWLQKLFPSSMMQREREYGLLWVGELQPTFLSRVYTIRLYYHHLDGLKVSVVMPDRLSMAEGKSKLPHVYSTVKQELCLFFPDGSEWNPSMLFTRTVIPWASEWLMYYELWLGDGQWRGGGTKHLFE